MTRIIIIGGHGKVARKATPLLVEDGHEVTSVIRDPDQSAAISKLGAEPAVADVASMQQRELEDLLRGHDLVVWSAGAGGGSAEKTYAVDRDAAIRSMDAAAAAGAERYVMVSYFGAGPDHGVPADNAFFHYAEAKAAADTHLEESALKWTILKPSALTEGPTTGRIDVRSADAGEVSRGNVAAVIRAVAGADPAAVAGLTIPFNDGDTPIEEGLRHVR
ncbi:putative sugar epimerase YhfK [Nocardioides dokdonensis FR1436]|uniref:Putative sugar epimerase YhfK n=1 Tax=Nocardioides dokdonensis FR1436 TaxID=1300347 RepID=A0A1A9GJ79_9ACTN|nr:SDR family oxidoreductase [Nocardioides dokdonensis]ANH37673.1 putative sugar epimerase YhfK [Nocardioides dokdonensis FR1436]